MHKENRRFVQRLHGGEKHLIDLIVATKGQSGIAQSVAGRRESLVIGGNHGCLTHHRLHSYLGRVSENYSWQLARFA
jgi:hypothetical protein